MAAATHGATLGAIRDARHSPESGKGLARVAAPRPAPLFAGYMRGGGK